MLFSFYFLLFIFAYTNCTGNVGDVYTSRTIDLESRNWIADPMKEYKAYRPPMIKDDNFKPSSFDAYVELKKHLASFGECPGNKCSNIKQMIRDGKLLNNTYLRTKKSAPIQPLLPKRLRRSSNLKIKDEIDSIKIVPVESNGTKEIECHKDSEEEISCRQDDFEYKIKLKHKDLSQESLESLIRQLYLRLSSSVPAEKRKRSEVFTSAPATNSNEAPFMIVLPPPAKRPDVAGCPNKNKETHTEWPYKQCKSCDLEDEEEVTTAIPVDQMVIECSPRDFDTVNPGMPRILDEDLGQTTTPPSAYIYSCRWQGKRQVETQNIVVPINPNNTSRSTRQSFKIIIDPSEASTNTLPISIVI